MSIRETRVPPRLGAGDAGRPTTAEEFAEADFDEPWRYERVAGRLVVMAPCGEDHVSSSEPWRDRLGAYKLARPDVVERVVSEAWVRIDDDNDRIGDIGVYLRGDGPAPPIPDRVPDLMFEFLSPGRRARDRDLVAKRAEYLRLGIREYVVIDRFERTATVFTRGARQYRKRVLAAGDTYASPLLPGLAIPLAEVFGA